MNCYECKKAGAETPAVAICDCGAAVCLEHTRALAVWRRDATHMVGCPHDTWLAAAEARTAIPVPRPRLQLLPRLA